LKEYINDARSHERQTDNCHNLQYLNKSTQQLAGQKQWQRTSKCHWRFSVHVIPAKLQLLRNTIDYRMTQRYPLTTNSPSTNYWSAPYLPMLPQSGATHRLPTIVIFKFFNPNVLEYPHLTPTFRS